MIDIIKKSLWQQFGASIDMLINSVSGCPDDYFRENKRYYYLAYHSVVFLDYYSSIPPSTFCPKLPFTIKPLEQRPKESIGDMIPDKIYSKEEMLGYLQSTRSKCKKMIQSLTNEESLNLRFVEGNEKDDMDYPVLEILLYNLRHTQHHIGQLNLIIRQDLDNHLEWAFRVDELGQNN